LVGIRTGDILSKTVGMLRSMQAFRFGESKDSKAAMPETSISMKWRPRGSRTALLSQAGGSNSELRLKSEAWRTTLESPELRERS
jgi:hypothetical protein